MLGIRRKFFSLRSLYFLSGGDSPVSLILLASLCPFTQYIPRESE